MEGGGGEGLAGGGTGEEPAAPAAAVGAPIGAFAAKSCLLEHDWLLLLRMVMVLGKNADWQMSLLLTSLQPIRSQAKAPAF